MSKQKTGIPGPWNLWRPLFRGVRKAFYPDPPVIGPTAPKDIKVGGGAEGTGISYPRGNEVIVEGQVLWIPISFEIEQASDSQGGRKGGDVVTVSNEYFVDVAWGFGATRLLDGVYNVEKVWLDEKLVYSTGDTIDTYGDQLGCNITYDTLGQKEFIVWWTSSGSITLQDIIVGRGIRAYGVGWNDKNLGNWEVVDKGQGPFTDIPTATSWCVTKAVKEGAKSENEWLSGPDVKAITRRADGTTYNGRFGVIANATNADFYLLDPSFTFGTIQVGDYVETSGFYYLQNNDVWRVNQIAYDEQPGGDPPYDARIQLYKESDPIAQGESGSRFVDQSNAGVNLNYCDDFRVWNGNDNQPIDPTLESRQVKPTAFRGHIVGVGEKIRMGEFGNRIPTATALVREVNTTALDADIKLTLEEVGITSTNYSVTANIGTLRGYTIEGPTKPIDTLRLMESVYSLSIFESAGKIKAFAKNRDEPNYYLRDGDVDATLYGTSPRVATIADINSIDLPREVNVKYIDAGGAAGSRIRHEPGSQRERRPFDGGQKVISLDTPFVFTGAEARAVARSVLYQSVTDRPVFLSLPPSKMDIEPGDIINDVTIDGETYDVRAERIIEGDNGMIEVEGVIFSAETFDVDGDADDGGGSDGGSGDDGGGNATEVLAMVIVDVAKLDNPVPQCLHYAVDTLRYEGDFNRAIIYESTDNGLTFQEVSTQYVNSPVGQAYNALAESTNTWILTQTAMFFWDIESSMRVLVSGRTPPNYTDRDALRLNSAMYINGEVVAYVDTEDDSTSGLAGNPQSRRFSRFIRGARDTGLTMASHTNGNWPVAFMLNPGRQYLPLSESDEGLPRIYKAIEPNGDLDFAPQVSVTLTDRQRQPFVPMHFRAFLQPTSNNWVFEWIPRTRRIIDFLSFAGSLDNDEEIDDYIIVFYSSASFSTIVGSIQTGVVLQNSSTIIGRNGVLSGGDQLAIFGSIQTTLYARIFHRHATDSSVQSDAYYQTIVES